MLDIPPQLKHTSHNMSPNNQSLIYKVRYTLEFINTLKTVVLEPKRRSKRPPSDGFIRRSGRQKITRSCNVRPGTEYETVTQTHVHILTVEKREEEQGSEWRTDFSSAPCRLNSPVLPHHHPPPPLSLTHAHTLEGQRLCVAWREIQDRHRDSGGFCIFTTCCRPASYSDVLVGPRVRVKYKSSVFVWRV